MRLSRVRIVLASLIVVGLVTPAEIVSAQESKGDATSKRRLPVPLLRAGQPSSRPAVRPGPPAWVARRRRCVKDHREPFCRFAIIG